MTEQQLMDLMTKFMESLDRQAAAIKEIMNGTNEMVEAATARIETKLDEIEQKRMRISDQLAARHFADAGLE